MREIEFNLQGDYGTVQGGRLFGPNGGVQTAVEGFAQHRGVQRKRVTEAARLYSAVLSGREDPVFLREAMRPTHPVFVNYLQEKYPALYGDPGGRNLLGLRETMSVTDYQALFVDVLDRMYYGYYNAYPIVNKGLVKVHQLRDFRLVSRYLLDGVVTPLTAMDAAAPPPQRALLGPDPQDGHPATSTAPLQYQPKLYQAMTSVNWRAFVNDDLGIFKDLSNRLAIAGNRGISKNITLQYMDTNGPNALLYTSNYGNIINSANGASQNNPPLNAQGVSDALKILAGMKDSGGDPILMTGMKARLWYGPVYYAAAQNLKRSLNMYITQEGGVSGSSQPGMFVNTENWIMQDLELIMDPYIPIVCTSHPTSWGITVEPEAMARPSVEFGFLTGYETPQLFTKVPNTQRMGGGVDPTLGDFFTMDQDMKIVTVFGGTQIDGRSTVASNGSGS